MIFLSKDKELDKVTLEKMISHFNLNVKPKLMKYKNYYDGLQAILNKKYVDPQKPCNKTVINYCKNIADSYAGYIATPGHISYSSDNDISEVMDVLRYNDYQTEDAKFLLSALIHGVAAELMFIDEKAKTRFRLINPTQCFGIYDDSLTGDLMYFVRIYKESDWDASSTYKVDVYTDSVIKHYTMSGENGSLSFISEKNHNFNQVPANIFALPDEKSIFDCIMSQQDSINELISAEIDDYTAFCDAYLTFTGVDADEDIISMRERRVFLLPEGATANWLTKNANDAQVENILNRTHAGIYRVAQCPDFSSESFVGGVSSGIAIQYRLTGMETRAGIIEGAMKEALQRRIEIICGVASLMVGEELFSGVRITFKRNIPEDASAKAELVSKLKNSVSDETLLEQLPFIQDVNGELERLKKQKSENMEMYGFPVPSTEEDADLDE